MRDPSKEKRGAPPWLLKQEGLTQRQWKARKRREIRALWAAFDQFRMGCAHTPLRNAEVSALKDVIVSIAHQLTVKEWGR